MDKEMEVSGGPDEGPRGKGYLKETIHGMLRRCEGWDYSLPCMYMITVVLANRRSRALGEVRSSVIGGSSVIGDNIADHRTRDHRTRGDIADHRTHPISPRFVQCELTALGKAVEECWEAIPQFYPQVQIIRKQVMPDHFHGILWVKDPLGCHLGQVVKGFKIGCNRAARRLCPGLLAEGAGLFAEGFQDSILFHEGQLEKMIAYIEANPLRLAVKCARPGLFTMVRGVRVEGSVIGGSSVIGDNIADHRTRDNIADHRTRDYRTPLSFPLYFSAIGNRALLARPMVQVQCSRRHFGYKRIAKPGGGMKIARDAAWNPIVDFATPEFEKQRSRLLAAARHGVVLISPCISDGEREIARAALAEGLPLVTMQNKGFSKLEKPTGRYFDACAAGRLLMLAPAAWPYTPAHKPMARHEATAMNRLCQWIAGEGAATVNYRGLAPANIDKIALAAASKAP